MNLPKSMLRSDQWSFVPDNMAYYRDKHSLWLKNSKPLSKIYLSLKPGS